MKSIRPDLAGQILESVEKRMVTHPDQVRARKVSPGKMIIAQDGAPEALFFILHGKVKIFHTTLKGSEYLMAVAGPGELVGEVEILTNENHVCSVKALTGCRLGVVKKTAYLAWLREDHHFSLLVNQAICFRLRKISARAAMHLIYPLEYSVLKYIKDAVQASPVQRLQVSRKELAEYLGTSPRSINRILKKLQEQGILCVAKDEIRVVSMDFLERFLLVHEH
ncbi:MAG: Crp/Fnr family transcriptional regulator [Desulfobacterales bacterium]|nr:Crp/Fnr family transcriptional regulator [Desulfobacterales bacterium]